MEFSQYVNIEEYQNSFTYLDAKLIQLSTGFFNSTSQTFNNDLILLDRRITKATFAHHCELSKDTLNFVFCNSTPNLSINGQQIEDKNQIVVFGGEDLSAIINGELDITTISLPMASIRPYFPEKFFQFTTLDGERIRSASTSTTIREKMRVLVNIYLTLLEGKNISRQFIVDMTDNLLFKIMCYLESFEISSSDSKQRLSAQEINRVLEFIFNTDVFSLKELQAICMCSPRTLNNLINLHFGCPPNKLISVMRLNKINAYLHKTSSQQRTIKHICEKFGVYSRYRLAKDYQTMFGKSIKETIKTAAEY